MTHPIIKTDNYILITSDEEIKEGDYFYLYDADIVTKYLSVKPVKEAKKIILTTDQALDGVQVINDEFLEWFVKNPSCEEVEVADLWKEGSPSTHDSYQIIIPKEEPKYPIGGYAPGVIYYGTCKTEFMGDKRAVQCEPCAVAMTKEEPKQEFTLEQIDQNNPVTRGSTALVYKQETLEEAAKIEKIAMDKLKSKWEHLYTFGYPQKPFPTNYENDLNNVKVGLYEGAKWQQERMYSEKEVEGIIASLLHTPKLVEESSWEGIAKWFEQFKKK